NLFEKFNIALPHETSPLVGGRGTARVACPLPAAVPHRVREYATLCWAIKPLRGKYRLALLPQRGSLAQPGGAYSRTPGGPPAATAPRRPTPCTPRFASRRSGCFRLTAVTSAETRPAPGRCPRTLTRNTASPPAARLGSGSKTTTCWPCWPFVGPSARVSSSPSV